MNENLPEINFKEKKEKKGFLPWLKGRLGFGSSGGGLGGISPTAANFGKLGAAKFGASAGIGGFLAGKASMLVTLAVVAVGTGVYMANNGPAPQDNSSFNSAKAPAADTDYVPAILRSQAQNQGSSLDMFKDTNKSSGVMTENEAEIKAEQEAAARKAQEEEAAAQRAQEEREQNQPPAENNTMQQDMMGKLQGGGGSLSSSLGGGSSRFSGMGGFNNKFGQGAIGPKVGMSNMGTSFTAMPNFDRRKKMLAMKTNSRPVFSSARGGKGGPIGKGSFSQAKAVKGIQRSYNGNGADENRATQDKAWGEGTTDGGVGAGGAGISGGSGGGAGIVTSPSLDNLGGGGGGGGSANPGDPNFDPNNPDEPTIPDPSTPTNVSPWASMVKNMMMMLVISAVLSMIGSKLVQAGQKTLGSCGGGAVLIAIGQAICAVAAALGAMVGIMGMMLMGQHGQAMLGMIYVAGGAMAVAGAMMSMVGGEGGTSAGWFAGMKAMFSPLYMLGGAVAAGMIGSMFAGK